MGKLFGTDGVRGVANEELTPELGLRLGRAIGTTLVQEVSGRRPRLVIGRDTRVSGAMLEAALVAGATSAGVDCYVAGVLPTPGVAYLVRSEGFDSGAVISASHNPVEDNGIKFFGAGGYKLPDATEADIEQTVVALDEGRDPLRRATGGQVGRVFSASGLGQKYIEFLKRAFPIDLSGMKLVIDCGHGAAAPYAAKLFSELGADVVALNDVADGEKINVRCGSTYPEVVQEAVKAHGAQVGLTFDGDADRVLAVDEQGELLNGDHILAILAQEMKKRNALQGDGVAATVYSNLGLKLALKALGVRLVETQAGDRYVLEAMRQDGLVLGGEQSGHIILLEHNTTGDGMLTGIALLAAQIKEGVPMSNMRQVMRLLPQALESVKVSEKNGWENNAAVQAAIDEARRRLKTGRIFVRASGTEPVIRVMAEGEDESEVHSLVQEVVGVIQKELG